MKNIIKYQFSAITVCVIILCMLFFTKCINNEKKTTDEKVTTSRYNQFAGSAACVSCHKTIYNSHINTAHFHTSEMASEKNIKGSFDTGKNTFTYNSGGYIAMEKRPGGFYQAAYINGIQKKSERFDITIGSGIKGQSYASWVGDKLVQLPITYFTSAGEWSNSPGYPDKIAFNRPITSRCLECHSSYAEKKLVSEATPEAFDKDRMILGVDCEKCHGPAAKHVAFQTKNPGEKTAKFILNPASFTRLQSLDMCAVCHGGRLQKTKPSFQFTAGDKLSDYFVVDTTSKDVNSIDVHGNQYGLLAASKCFKNTSTLTCNSCHNPHENEAGKAITFAQRCAGCHNETHNGGVLCKMATTLSKDNLDKNCISCHMPQQPSMAIAVLLQGKNTPAAALMHTHFIKNYPEETKKVLAFIKEK